MPARGKHARVLEPPDKKQDTGTPTTKPPSVDDWQDFIGRVVMHTAMEAYVAYVLRDVDMTPEEEASIALTKQDYKELSAPLASFTAKTDFAKKHGRTIIASADSVESLVALGIWMRRVNRIAKRHRPEIQAKRAARGRVGGSHVHAQPPSEFQTQANAPQQTGPVINPPANADLVFQRPTGEQLAAMAAPSQTQTASPVHERATLNGHSGPSAGEGIRKPQPPGAYGGNFSGNTGTG